MRRTGSSGAVLGAGLLALAAIATLVFSPGRAPAHSASVPLPPPPARPTECRSSLESGAALGPGIGQTLDGSLTGCVQLGRLAPGRYTAYLTAGSVKPATAGMAPVTGRLQLTPSHGRPGARVVASGTVPTSGAPRGTFLPFLPDHARVCWAGCEDGLVEQPEVTWDGNQFRAEFQVPTLPWLGANGTHAMQPGAVEVRMPCVPDRPQTGCVGLAGTFTLEGPAPAPRSTWVRLTPRAAAPGELMSVDGWAPLRYVWPQGTLTLTPSTYYLALQLPPGSPPPLATATFTVQPPRAWAESRVPTPAWLADAGVPPVAVSGGGRRLAYCSVDGVRLSEDAGATWRTIPLGQLSAVAQGAGLRPFAGVNTPACDSVTLDPARPGSLYVIFFASPPQGAPPIDELGAVSSDGAASWRLVTPARGTPATSFGGFHPVGDGVDAYFFADAGTVSLRSTDGGVRWSDAGLTCPAIGPCTVLGAESEGSCAKGQSRQLLEVSADHGASWTQAHEVSPLFTCDRIHLAGLADGRLLLLDGASEHAVMVSSDGGASWTAVELPVLDTTLPYPTYGDLQLLPDGSLLAVGGEAALLRPGTGQWCRTKVQGLTHPVLVADRLYWRPQQIDFQAPAPEGVRSIGLAELGC